jgi:hypothetical protein
MRLNAQSRIKWVVAMMAATVATWPLSVLAQSAPTPGPCEQVGAIGAIVDRPGLGRPTANNGSPCVVPSTHVLIEVGYRNETTTGAGGTSTLDVFPLPLIRIGLGRRSEIVVQPPSQSVRSGAALGGVFVPMVGTQDAGVGFKHMLDDRPSFQDSVGAFYSGPTGSPQGSAGFSAGGPTYTLTYTAAFAPAPNIGISINQSETANASPLPLAGAMRFFNYQLWLTASYTFAPKTTLLVTDQITAPLGPNAGSGNRALVAVQRVLSKAVVIDAEFEVNALPVAPALRQHAVGVGGAFAL